MIAKRLVRALAAGAALCLAASPAAAEPIERWSGEIAEASARFGVPIAWIRKVMLVESGGRATRGGRPVRSSAGAMGLMQLMPGTWTAMRAQHGLGADPDEPRDNILAGTAYLRAMFDRFGYPGLFGAYNAGPARYASHLASGSRLPRETVAYMAAITGRTAGGSKAPAAVQLAGTKPSTTVFVATGARPFGSSSDRGAASAPGDLFFVRRQQP